ncbi:MAG: LytTR family transcriptional regulator [Gammaproteobacteria bacterium]|nr:LytTR family transcriptional regulator [Gammaproteobacteria bacterium]
MTIEGLHNYLSTRLPLQLNAKQHFRLLTIVFTLVFASSVMIHLLTQEENTLLGTLIHAGTIGLIYVVGIGLAMTFLHALLDATKDVRVWQLWVASMAGFILGYYYLPFNELIDWLSGMQTNNHVRPMRFSQLLPIWFLATYLFVQPYLTESLKSELVRLRDINELLERRDSGIETVDDKPIRFESGRTDFVLIAETIRNIVVEDHYCYVHYQHDDGYAKRDLAMPLRDVQTLLPSNFVQVHRSHIVNLSHIATVRRKNRSIRLILDNGYEVPVSRHRLDEVLPLLRQQIVSLGAIGTP